MYYNYSHRPEPEQITSNPMRELLAGETILTLNVKGCGYIKGDIVIITGDTTQIRPGDCVLYDWQRALRSGRLGACLGGYGPVYTPATISKVPGDTLAFAVPEYDGQGDRIVNIGSLTGTSNQNNQGGNQASYTLASNEFIINGETGILLTDALIHSKIVTKVGHDEAAAREFSQRVY